MSDREQDEGLTTLQYDRQKFGKAVREYRGPQTARQFSNRTGISPGVLSRVERGKVVYDDVIERLCKLLGVSIGEFPAGQAGKDDKAKE